MSKALLIAATAILCYLAGKELVKAAEHVNSKLVLSLDKAKNQGQTQGQDPARIKWVKP